MSVRLKPVSQQVIVITGASSRIGLATAQAAAAEGARVVLSSRSGEALGRIVDEIKSRGGEALYVVADVSKREHMERLAVATISRFGGFDTWVNNARLGCGAALNRFQMPIIASCSISTSGAWSMVPPLPSGI